jgi:uncharacterized membrane protein YgdD (TMEM256/DUF423 family)
MVGSTMLTGAVAMVLGVAIGAIGVVALRDTVSPSAKTVSTSSDQGDTSATKPQVYGSR